MLVLLTADQFLTLFLITAPSLIFLLTRQVLICFAVIFKHFLGKFHEKHKKLKLKNFLAVLLFYSIFFLLHQNPEKRSNDLFLYMPRPTIIRCNIAMNTNTEQTVFLGPTSALEYTITF